MPTESHKKSRVWYYDGLWAACFCSAAHWSGKVRLQVSLIRLFPLGVILLKLPVITAYEPPKQAPWRWLLV